MIIRRCVPENEQGKILDDLMGGTFQEKEQLIRYSNRDFIGPRFLEIVLNGLNYVTDAKRLEISAAEMKCP